MATVTQYTATCHVCGGLGDYDDQGDAQSAASDHDSDPSFAGHQSTVAVTQYDDGSGAPDASASDASPEAAHDPAADDPAAYDPALAGGFDTDDAQPEHDQAVSVDAQY